METGISGEKMVHVMRNSRGKIRFIGILKFGEHKNAFKICFPHRKLKSQFLTGKKQQVEIMQ